MSNSSVNSGTIGWVLEIASSGGVGVLGTALASCGGSLAARGEGLVSVN